MAKKSRPPWQLELGWCESWTHHQFLSALCGEDPDVAETSPDEWTAERQRVERQVDAAIRAGELTVDYFRAATEDTPYGDYYVSRGVAIRWATKIPGRFPQFPFTVDDLPVESSSHVPDRLPQRVLRLLEIAKAGKEQKQITTLIQTEFQVSKRTAESWAALFRPDEAVSQDRRAARRRH